MEIQNEWTSLSALDFFILNSETAAQVRASLFTQIHEIVFHGKGGYNWETVYNMPRWLRLFTFNKINEYYKKEAEEYEKASSQNSNKSTLIDSAGNINKHAFNEVSPKITPGPKIKYGQKS